MQENLVNALIGTAVVLVSLWVGFYVVVELTTLDDWWYIPTVVTFTWLAIGGAGVALHYYAMWRSENERD